MVTHRLTYLTLLALAIPAFAFAAGFDEPSNPAGLWAVEFEPGIHLVSFPLLPRDVSVQNVLHDHFPGTQYWDTSTRIFTVEDGISKFAYYNDEGEWSGSIDTLRLDRGYWLVIPDGAGTIEFDLAGGGHAMSETDLGEIDPGVNIVAAPAVVPVPLAGSGLAQSGLAGGEFAANADRVFTWIDGQLVPAWVNPEHGWIGAGFTFHPGRGYIVERTGGREPFNWTRPPLEFGGGAGDGTVVIPDALAPLVRSATIDFDTPPPGVKARAESEPDEPANPRRGRRVR